MEVNWAGMTLAGICLGIVILMIFCNKFIRKVTNSYFFWLVISAFFFIWLIYFRFAEEWSTYWSAVANHTITDPTTYGQSILISKGLILDTCPFAALAILLALILDPSRKVARAIAPMALIGGALIVFFQLPFDNSGTIMTRLDAQFIFIGDGGNKCYFLFHAINLLFAVGVLLNTPRGGWKGYCLSCGICFGYYIYVAICMVVTGCSWNVAGLNLNDWSPSGEYYVVARVLNLPPLPTACIGFVTLFAIFSLINYLNDYPFKRWIWKYGNKYHKWYCWYNYNAHTVQKYL